MLTYYKLQTIKENNLRFQEETSLLKAQIESCQADFKNVAELCELLKQNDNTRGK